MKSNPTSIRWDTEKLAQLKKQLENARPQELLDFLLDFWIENRDQVLLARRSYEVGGIQTGQVGQMVHETLSAENYPFPATPYVEETYGVAYDNSGLIGAPKMVELQKGTKVIPDQVVVEMIAGMSPTSMSESRDKPRIRKHSELPLDPLITVKLKAKELCPPGLFGIDRTMWIKDSIEKNA